MEDMAEDTCTGGLIRAAHRSCSRNDDESVKGGAERSDTKDDACDSHIDLPKVERQGTTEEQERKLQHQRQRLHHMVKVPGDDAVQFPLTILATLYGSPSQASRCVSVQPLLPEHREKSGEERSGETGVQHGLHIYDCTWRAGPLRNSGSVATERGVVYLVDEDS